jgi:glycosyltransferase involved in cell wall biosynthesis
MQPVNEVRVAHVATIAASLPDLLLNQLCSLQAAGYDVTAVCSPGPETAVLAGTGIRHLGVPMTRRLTPLADVLSLARLYRLFRRERFHIVHTHTPKAGLLGQLAARLAGVPVVVNTVHGFYFHEHMAWYARRLALAAERVAARCSDRILSQNQEDVRTALREGICGLERIIHLGNGIDLDVFTPDRFPAPVRQALRAELGLPPDAPVVGFVGRLSARRKGLADLLGAAAEVSQQCPDVRFLIVGEAAAGERDAVDPADVLASPVGRFCRFLGQRPFPEMPKLYSLMDVLVLPSAFEGLPRAIMEAAAMGVPAVATDVKGNREAVEAGRTGLLVPFRNPAALAAAIVHLVTDTARARQMGEAVRQRARERFDERAVFQTIQDEYAALLAQTGLSAVARTPAGPARAVGAASHP